MQCRLRNFVFTLNNYNMEDVNSILTSELFAYVIIGKEVGEKGTPHLQGYAELKKQTAFNTIKEIWNGMHIEPRRGSQLQAIDYCKKDKDFLEAGVMKKQGSRSDIHSIKEIVFSGGSIMDIVDESNSYQALRAGQLLLSFRPFPKKDYPKLVHWFHGSTGTGKTRQAIELSGDNYWISGENLKWFDGYIGQENVIIDDFRKDFCTFHYLLRLLDRYPLRVPIKGGFVEWHPLNIYITSCFEPSLVYNTREDVGQLLRRIDVIKEFVIKPDPIVPSMFEELLLNDEGLLINEDGYYFDELNNIRLYKPMSREERNESHYTGH